MLHSGSFLGAKKLSAAANAGTKRLCQTREWRIWILDIALNLLVTHFKKVSLILAFIHVESKILGLKIKIHP